MRRALGLQDDNQTRSAPGHPTTTTVRSHPQKRRFVQDGEVPVTVIHRDHRPDEASGTNQLEQARQAIRAQAAARERAERLLADAQAAVRDLQTKLAHERLAKDEAVQRAEAEKQASEQALQSVRAELEAERLARLNAETTVKSAVEAREVVVPASPDEAAVVVVRRPVGRPRKVAIAKPDPAPTTPGVSARRHAKPGRPAKLRVAKEPRGSKPIKWWLQDQ